MMDAIDARNVGQTMLNFEKFCRDIDLKVNSVCRDKILRSFDGLWNSAINHAVSPTVIESYKKGMEKIEELVAQNISSPITPLKIEEVSVKNRLLLNLLMSLFDKDGHISVDDKSKIAAFAILNDIDFKPIVDALQRNSRELNNEIGTIAKEIEATKELIFQLNLLIKELGKKGVVGVTFFVIIIFAVDFMIG